MSGQEHKARSDAGSLLRFLGGLFLLFAGGTEIVNNYRIPVAVAFGLLVSLGGAGLLVTEYGVKTSTYFRIAIYSVVVVCVLLWVASLK